MSYEVGLAATLALLIPAAALAQPPPTEPPAPPDHGTDVRAVILPGGGVTRLLTTWGDRPADNGARLLVEGRPPVTLHHDGPVAGTLALGHGALLVAFGTDDRRAPFRVRIARGEGAHFALGAVVRIARPGARRDFPFAVVATAVPDGFAVFFQEVQSDDPTAAHTYLVRLAPDGTPRGPAGEVPVPWSLADAAWNGHGFHLALIYPGDGRGMRLSMVSLTEAGQPQQHPDWSSRPGYITDVHLATDGPHVRAFYRGGGGGDRLLEREVTQIRSWGRNPPAPRDHGALPRDQVIALSTGQGRASARHVASGVH